MDATECAYCQHMVTTAEVAPADDDAAWACIATDDGHAADCEWVLTRAHQRDWSPLAALRRRHGDEERRLIRSALERNAWYVTRAATELGIGEKQLRDLIERHGLRAEYGERNHGRGRPEAKRKTGEP